MDDEYGKKNEQIKVIDPFFRGDQGQPGGEDVGKPATDDDPSPMLDFLQSILQDQRLFPASSISREALRVFFDPFKPRLLFLC